MCALFGLKPIANPGLAFDVPGIGRIALDLLAKPCDEYPQILGLVLPGGSPDGPQKHFTREHPPGRTSKQQQQIKLFWSEVNRCPAHQSCVRLFINDEVSKLNAQPKCLLDRQPPQLRTDTGKQLGHAEGFGQVVIRSFVQGLYLHRIAVAYTQHNDGRLCGAPNGTCQLKAIHLRHRQIGDHQVRPIRRKPLESLQTGCSHVYLISTALQGGAEHAKDLFLIIYNQYLGYLRVRHGASISCVTRHGTLPGSVLLKGQSPAALFVAARTISSMHSRRSISVVRWLLSFGALTGIVLVDRLWVHVNTTTVALTLLLLVLVLAAEWELRYAVITAVAATILYNFYFLPPIGTLTISDPQNWLALLAFLITAIIASRLSQRARSEATEARARQRELEVLFRLSQEFLRSESSKALLTSIPSAVLEATSASSALLYLLETDRLYRAGDAAPPIEESHLRRLAITLLDVRDAASEMEIPIRAGVRPKGVLVLHGVSLSKATAQAIGSLISISIERAQALESIAHSEAAKEGERLRTLMTDSITHELRTPLTSIKGAATALLGGVGLEQEQELLSIIDEETDRLNNLVSKAMEVAQLGAHQVQMHFDTVRVADMIANAREACSWIEEEHRLSIAIDEHLEIRADPDMFQKVIANLLENAAKYSNAGTPITITALREGERATISIADRGNGIEASEQPLIFERFYRARSQATSTSGTGMGLAISRAIVEAHGGTIGVISSVGEGSVFIVSIPAFPRLTDD